MDFPRVPEDARISALRFGENLVARIASVMLFTCPLFQRLTQLY
jgi:hypothetical protein